MLSAAGIDPQRACATIARCDAAIVPSQRHALKDDLEHLFIADQSDGAHKQVEAVLLALAGARRRGCSKGGTRSTSGERRDAHGQTDLRDFRGYLASAIGRARLRRCPSGATTGWIWSPCRILSALASVLSEVRRRGCRALFRRTSMLLITGAAGASGRLIVKALSQQGQRLRALIRHPEKAELFSGMQGVEVQVADLARPQTLGPALDGVDTALLISSADERMLETQCAFVDAARASGVRRIVKFSGQESGIGFDAKAFRFTRMHDEIEAHIERSGLRWTHLRPSQFMQVYLREAPSIAKAGVLALPAGDIELSPVNLADI